MLQRVGRGVVPRARGRAAVPAASLRSGKWESLHVTASASDVRSKRQGESAIPTNPDEIYSFHSPPFKRTRREKLAKNWDNLGFSIRPMNGYVKFTWRDGEWDEGSFVPAPYQLLHINSGALHYGVSVFEGMKAFACADGKVRIACPDLNADRMRRGAEKLLMPAVPEEMFVRGVTEAVERNREFVPPYGHSAAMYIRPLLFASGPMLGLAPLAEEYTFFVTVMPTGGYFAASADDSADAKEVGVKALVSEDHDRAAPRGTGNVKAAGNYAADLSPVHSAHKSGFNTTLYLDAREQRYLEEFSVANFVGVTHDGVYVTPKSNTILASTTNMLLMRLARARGMRVEERPVDFEAEISDFREVGMCGTAAVVVKVESITKGDTTYTFEDFDTIASLRSALTAVQCGEAPDDLGFMHEVCDAFDSSKDVVATESKLDSAAMLSSVGLHDGLEQAGSPLVRKLVGTQSSSGESSDTWYTGYERELLDHVVQNATPGNPDDVLRAMDDYWNTKFPRLREKYSARWQARYQAVTEKTAEVIEVHGGRPLRCLELGTYCGYTAILIAKQLPEGSMLVSCETDTLFAAFATKIVEFAGMEAKTKIWMGDADGELGRVHSILDNQPADLVLFDHSRDRYVDDLNLLQEVGLVDSDTHVMFDLGAYAGDDTVTRDVREEIFAAFSDHNAVATML